MSRASTKTAVYHRDDAARRRDVEYIAPQLRTESVPGAVSVQRLASVGAPTWSYVHPTAYSITRFETPPRGIECNSMSEYEVGCHLHRECYGHLSRTPAGIVIVPGTLARRTTDNRNLFNELAMSVFQRSIRRSAVFYQDALRGMMLGKRGQVRGSMESASIEGSARLVIVPCWDLGYDEVCLPISMAKNFRAATMVYGSNGDRRTTYGEVSIRSGDWVLMVRPPSLSHASVQPFKVKLWERPCIGLYPGRCSEFHADYDGDEMQMYHLSDPESIAECKAWCPVSRDPFIEAGEKFRQLTHEAAGLAVPTKPQDFSSNNRSYRNTFMAASNMSMEEVINGVPYPHFTRESRMKPAMMSEFSQRAKDTAFREQALRYVAASIAGQSDVARQQLSQGHIGDVSRQARLAASCFKATEDGTITVAEADGVRVVGREPSLCSTRGNVMLRGINAMCGKAQQALLDSHRAGISHYTARNLIEDALQGSDVGLYVLPPTAQNWAPRMAACKWVSSTTEYTIALVDRNNDRTAFDRCASGLLSPWSLAGRAKQEREQGVPEAEVASICRRLCRLALSVVCTHCDVELSTEELTGVAWMLAYKPEADVHPVTNRAGFKARNLRPLVDMAVNHFGRFHRLCEGGSFDNKVEITTLVEGLILGGEFPQLYSTSSP